jgi:hypothetical protein
MLPRKLAGLALCALLTIVTLGAAPAPNAAAGIDTGCGVTGGTLTMLATDNESDFAAFSLLDPRGDEIARQYIPMFSPDASAELMLTPLGFGPNASVSSVKCLADSSLRRCADAKWQPIDEGVSVSISGVLIGLDWAIVSVRGHYVNVASPIAGSIDGASVGFQLDNEPVRWSAFYDSQTEASQAFYGLKNGAHEVTLGWRDPERDAIVPQDRLCFRL